MSEYFLIFVLQKKNQLDMKANVDEELCIGCGICENICPGVFEIKDDDKSHVKIDPVPDEFKGCTLEAETECPVQAISHNE